MKRLKVVGASVSLIQEGKSYRDLGFGVKSTKTKQPITTNSVFQAASLSKPVFAYAVLKMHETGALNLDAPLSEYLSEPYIPDEPRLKLISMRHVLNHTTGFPNWSRDNPLSINHYPGEMFSYSGEGYVYLQKVVEEITCQSISEFMNERLIEPFGMKNSSYMWIEDYEKTAVYPHNSKGASEDFQRYLQGNVAYSLYTTSNDYAKFIAEIMRPSSEDDFHLSRKTIDEMLRPQVRVSDQLSWGLGWGIQHTEKGVSYWHWGDNTGFKTFAMFSIENQDGIVVLTNSENGLKLIETIMSKVVDGGHRAFSDYLRVEYPNLFSRTKI